MADSLSIADLEALMLPPAPPHWATTIRAARSVKVWATPTVERGMGFVLNPAGMLHPEPDGSVVVLCHPEDERTVREAVEYLRNPAALAPAEREEAG